MSGIDKQPELAESTCDPSSFVSFFFDETQLPKYIYDPGTLNICAVNDFALEFYQYSKNEFLLLKITDLVSIDTGPPESMGNISQHRLKNGMLRYVEIFTTPIKIKAIDYVHVTVIDVTAKIAAQNNLKDNNVLLAEADTTLKKVLSTIDSEKNSIRCVVANNIDHTIRPLLKNAKSACPRRHPECQKTLDIVDKLLLTITRQALGNTTYVNGKLSPTEIKVCTLIHSGYGLKEISTIEGVSINTIKTQVKSIRKKIGLTPADGPLKGHLDGFSSSQ